MALTARMIRAKIVGTAFPFLFRPDVTRQDLIRIGTDYGGWWVPSDLVGPDSICYCAGVGFDISFDLGLSEKFGCRVWGIDPTPASIEWVEKQGLDEKTFTMIPYGLARTAGSYRFYKPRNAAFISHSITNLQGTSDWIEIECRTVSDVMAQNGHTGLTLLKLDIEGAQHEVLESMLESKVLPKILCVEFDQPEKLSVTRGAVRKLRAVGYELTKVDWFNMTFVLSDGASGV